MKLIHLTDPHLVRPGGRLYGLDPAERLRLAVDDINRHHPDAEFALITGDLTHWGERDAYAELAAVLRRLRMPCRVLIGNHDDRAAVLEAFPLTPRDAHGFVQSTFQSSVGVFVLLDTKVDGSHRGALCEHRLEWLQRQLEGHRSRPLFLALHHPPVRCGMPAMDGLGLANASDLWRCLAPHAGRLRHIFFGHLHRPMSGSWHGIPFSTLRGTSHQVALDFQTTGDIVTVSLEPPAYCVVLVSDEAVVVHQHDFLDSSPRYLHLEAAMQDVGEAAARPEPAI